MVRPAALLAGALGIQRLAELAHARRNERRARARGAVEHGAAHYPLIVLLHAGWLVATVVEGRRRRPRLGPLAALVGAQALRYWAIASLGPQWTTRVLVDPGARPVTGGPYRWLRHPNYVAVAVEIAALPLSVGARRTAIVASALDGVLLAHRIRVEDAARQGVAVG